jgi:DNA-binding SARP family transcriptional activator/tetratricopeptide (TPR) repeat protein
VWFGLLGPLLVQLDDGVPRQLAPRQRVLLAALLQVPGQAVSVQRLSELVWDGQPPPSSAVTLRSYVKRLRDALGPAGQARIVAAGGGYMIDAADDEIDVAQFETRMRAGVSAARTGDWRRALDLLNGALALWRGIALADVPSRELQLAEVPRLQEARLEAISWRIEADLWLGNAGEVVPELRSLIAEFPLRESFYGQLMVALCRSDRRADALAVFRAARRVLVSDVGVEPGPELQRLHARILAGDPELLTAPALAGARTGIRARVVPRQLPSPVPHFAGRAAELRVLDGLASTKTRMVVIDGTPGVGKTALAVHWAHRVTASFPDGQLYLNLNGFGPTGTPMTPMDAVGGMLYALNGNETRIPATLDGRVVLYRSLLAGCRMLIVLDNAKDADQVRPLLPGGAGCMVLVTSRVKLAGLVALEAARVLSLDVLTHAEARELVAARLGAEVAAADPGATGRLIDGCARLPLALAIATALIATSPGQSIAMVAAELADTGHGVDALDAGETTARLRAVLDWSYALLSRPAANMFNLMAEHPGPDITAAAAASLAGTPAAAARATLAELATANLVSEHNGRFAFHDLLRLYAASQLATSSNDGRGEAGLRMLVHYTQTAMAAALAISPARELPALQPPSAGVQPESLTSQDQAVSWLRAEHQVLMRVISYASGTGADDYAWRLPLALTDFLDRAGHWHDWAASQRIALAAAQRLGDMFAQAQAHRYIGRASLQLQRDDDALDELTIALGLRHQLGQPTAEAGIYIDLCRVHERRGHIAEALHAARQALQLYRTTGHRAGEAHALNAVGWQLALLGSYSQALGYCEQSLQLATSLELHVVAAQAWDSIGFARHHLKEPERAISSYQHSIDLLEHIGDQYQLTRALTHLGDAQQAAGDPGAARQTWLSALTILDELDHPDADQVRAKIAAARE